MGKGHAVAAARPFLGARSDGAMNPYLTTTDRRSRRGNGSTQKRSPTAPSGTQWGSTWGGRYTVAKLFTRGCVTTEDHATRV